MSDTPRLSPDQVLANAIAEKDSSKFAGTKYPPDKTLQACQTAIAAVYRAAAAGNVTCRDAVIEIEKILNT